MTDCTNCRGSFDPDTSTSQDPERFCDSRCEGQHLGAVDPDELGTFGEVLDYWTMRGGMTDDERSAFWQSWSRHTIAWTLVLVGGVTFMESFDGLAGDAGLFVAVYAALVLGWQAVEAVRFRWQARRWNR